jgi:intracellular sulfur oxidation DsrE/DsrF family protein
MTPSPATPRRGFLARLAVAAAAFGFGALRPRSALASQRAEPDHWIDALTGKHRCLFDFPQHDDGLPLIHIYNYLNTYKTAYGESGESVNAVGTFYGSGAGASIPLGWNDTIWEKYKIGEVLKLVDPRTNQPAVRNMFWKPREGDPVLRSGAVTVAGIENLERMGATFLMCNNSLLNWSGFLAGRDGRPANVERDLRANLLPRVTVVPAMVIAIEKAQGAGIAYNRQ